MTEDTNNNIKSCKFLEPSLDNSVTANAPDTHACTIQSPKNSLQGFGSDPHSCHTPSLCSFPSVFVISFERFSLSSTIMVVIASVIVTRVCNPYRCHATRIHPVYLAHKYLSGGIQISYYDVDARNMSRILARRCARHRPTVQPTNQQLLSHTQPQPRPHDT